MEGRKGSSYQVRDTTETINIIIRDELYVASQIERCNYNFPFLERVNAKGVIYKVWRQTGNSSNNFYKSSIAELLIRNTQSVDALCAK